MASAPTPTSANRPTSGRLIRLIGKSPWGVADQMLISATNMVTMVLMANAVDKPAFGQFAIVFSVLLVIAGVQAGLITEPHNVIGAQRAGGAYRIYTSSTGLIQMIFSAAMCIGALLVGAVMFAFDLPAAHLVVALGPAIALWQGQEFIRRVLYTEGRLPAAFVNDLLSYGGQTAAIVALFYAEALSGPIALYALAATSGLAMLFGLIQLSGSFTRSFCRDIISENWHYGKWLAGGSLVWHLFAGNSIFYMTGAIIGAFAAGVLQAVHTLFGPARVLARVFEVMLPISMSRAQASHGDRGSHRQLLLALGVAVPVLGGFCALVALFAQSILDLVYPDEYAEYAGVLALYAGVMFVCWLEMIMKSALKVTRQTQQIFWSEIGSAAFAIPGGIVLIYFYDIRGAAIGMILAQAILLGLLCWHYHRRTIFDGPTTADESSNAAAGAIAPPDVEIA